MGDGRLRRRASALERRRWVSGCARTWENGTRLPAPALPGKNDDVGFWVVRARPGTGLGSRLRHGFLDRRFSPAALPMIDDRDSLNPARLRRSPTRAVGLRAAQRHASPAPLAASIDGTTRWHETRMKNAPGLMTRQRRQVRAMLGRGLDRRGRMNNRFKQILRFFARFISFYICFYLYYHFIKLIILHTNSNPDSL